MNTYSFDKTLESLDFSLVFKGLVKLGNIVAETLFFVWFPWVAKLAGNKQNVLLPQGQNEELLSAKNK